MAGQSASAPARTGNRPLARHNARPWSESLRPVSTVSRITGRSDVSLRVIAFHYPKPEHHHEMVQCIGHAAELMTTVPGCLEVDYWKEESSGAVVATGKFDFALARVQGARDRAASPRTGGAS